MPMIKKFLPTLLLVLFVYAGYFFTHLPTHSTTKTILGASAHIQLFVQPTEGRQPLLDAINAAQKEILVEVYLLSDKQIIAALEDAKTRGVTVQVMMEQHPVGGGSLNQKTKTQLDADGVQTEWSDPAFALTHEKSITIDNSETFILSQNLTASSFTKNREYDVLDTNPADVAEVRTIFLDDWQRKPFIAPPSTTVIESPDNARLALTTIINTSQQDIDAETEDIDDNQLVADLSQKATKETVRLLVPTLSQLSSNEKALQALAASGVEVRTISSPYMHAKMILSDNTRAYIGSVNFSTQSLDENRELGIILTQPDALQTLTQTFEEDWAKAKPFEE